ncbi:MAG TPA: glycoside hydrolase family 3 N-terminal domain-containing protein [Candidatus Eisenbacteria bacterium]|nr:glycoside hydrolase family 3 N-terminal domain-containing protein [Candidatus Eisenbacteria bacterium]
MRLMDGQRGIARRMVVGLPAEGLSRVWEKDFAAYAPAGVILFRRDFPDLESLRTLTQRLRELARPRRIFIAVDEEGGFVSQLAGLLVVPPNAALLARGAEGDDLEWTARVTGERLRALGIDWVYAPVADIHSQPANPVIGPRAFGTDEGSVSRAVASMLAGYRAAGIASCLKHFPGHGDTVLDSHHALPRCDADMGRLEARELAPFRAHLDAPAIMTAHVVYPALDPGQPATFSSAVVEGLLRRRLGYRGLVTTDALEMRGATQAGGAAEVGRRALDAGCDLLLYAFHHEDVRRARYELGKQLVDGALDHARFDDARPRLAEFDRRHPEPGERDILRPLSELTPHDWEARLERIVERGLIVRGEIPPAAAAGPWRIREPELPHGSSLRDELATHGIRANGESPSLEVVAVMSRKPLEDAEIERLRATARATSTALIGLQNDAFLDLVPEAALRISASDATPLTRRVVARALASAARATTRA